MGYIRHYAIVVTSYSDEKIKPLHKKAKKIFGKLVSNIVQSKRNGFETFFIGPDGSKLGWETSNKGIKKRSKFISILQKKGVTYCEFFYGDDEFESRVTKHN